MIKIRTKKICFFSSNHFFSSFLRNLMQNRHSSKLITLKAELTVKAVYGCYLKGNSTEDDLSTHLLC